MFVIDMGITENQYLRFFADVNLKKLLDPAGSSNAWVDDSIGSINLTICLLELLLSNLQAISLYILFNSY